MRSILGIIYGLGIICEGSSLTLSALIVIQNVFLLVLKVAGGYVDMATGSDQGCSVRVPASLCGIVGLKPTYGLVPFTGIMSLDVTLDHTGPLARTVYDIALMLEVR